MFANERQMHGQKNITGQERPDDTFLQSGEKDMEACIEGKTMVDGSVSPKVDIEEEDSSSDTITIPYRPSDVRVYTHPMNIGDLIEMIGAKWINFDTEYQRVADLWTDEKQRRLIESILLGLPLPAFYFEEISRRKWNIIDGLQRCCAIQNFCVNKTLKLSGLEFLGDEFNGKGYDDFPFEIRRDLKMLPITVNILQTGTPPNVKYILFKRLNTGGMMLKPQEIRTAMFPEVVGVLRSMAESAVFLRVTHNKIPTKRQEDKDFVSRFIAFHLLGYESYKSSMDIDTFVNESMLKLRSELSSGRRKKLEADFARALLIAEKIFGDDAFRKRKTRDEGRKPLNKAYFEVLTTSFARLSVADENCLVSRKELLKDNLMYLMNIPAFETAISTGTGILDRVQTRFKGVADAIRATLEDRKLGEEKC